MCDTFNTNFTNTLLDALPNPVYIKDTQGLFINCNLAFERLVQCEKEKILGKSAYSFFTSEVASRHRKIDEQIIKDKKNYTDDIIFPTIDGKIRHFTLSKSVYLHVDKSVGGTICIMHDTTRNLKEKEILIQQNKFAEMGEMIAYIAHQWNEPLVELSAQIQKLEFLFLNNELNNIEVSNFVNACMIQVKYMSQTLNDFRDFLKPSSKKNKFGIKKAVAEVFDIVGKQLFNFNIKVTFEYDDVEIYMYGFKNEIKQVLLNIINNAKNKIIKQIYEKKLQGLIKIKILQRKRYVDISIMDNGGAIEKDVIEYIFEPFFTTDDNSSGYGLYMAKDIVQNRHNGKIGVKNLHQCVIFSIKLPTNELR